MNKNRFESNQRYFTICIYTVFVILAGSCVIFSGDFSLGRHDRFS